MAELHRLLELLEMRAYMDAYSYSQILLTTKGETWESILSKWHDDIWRALICSWAPNLQYIKKHHLGMLYTDCKYLHTLQDHDVITRNYRQVISRENVVKIPDLLQDQSWSPCNPSICINYERSGYYLNQRYVNFSSHRATNYKCHTADGIFNTRNILIRLNAEFQIVSYAELHDLPEREKYQRRLTGLEDMNIFQLKEKQKKNKGKRLGFFCTLVDARPSCVPLMGYGLINLNTNKITKITALKSPMDDRCEKNWLPYTTPGHVNFVYTGTNMARYTLNGDTPQIIGSSTYDSKLRGVRGGGGPLSFQGGYLFLFHEVIFTQEGRTYLHRFIVTDKLFNEQRISHVFTFDNKDIEFARSICWNLDETRIIISLGIEDNQALLYFIDPDDINKMLVF